MILISVKGGTTLPADEGLFMYSSPAPIVPRAFVSVKPYPIPGRPLKFLSSAFTCSAGLGPPPPPSVLKDDKS